MLISFNAVARANTKDSIYCDINNPDSSRILLYDGNYFIWINENHADNIITAIYGNYKIKDDSIFFTEPDSTAKPNRFFCYCKKEKHPKQFQLYTKRNPENSFSYIYQYIFNRKNPNLIEIEATRNIKGQYDAVGRIIFYINSKKYIFKKQ